MSRKPVSSPRLDFADLKRRVSIEDALAARGLLDGLRRRGDRLTGPCPLHGGDNPTAFVVDRARNLWYCFTGCGRGGDLIDLVRRLDHISHHEAAARLQAMAPSVLPGPVPRGPFVPYERTMRLHHDTPWLAAKGITPETAQTYEAAAWSGRGMLTGCIAVRLHGPAGAPLGYAGRRLDPGRGKWVFPRGFPKSDVLYGHHRVDPLARRLVVVECPWGVMRLAQIGVPAVALLGTSVSARQAELLAARERLTLVFDGDDAGRRGAQAVASRLGAAVTIEVIELLEGADPDDLSDGSLRALVGCRRRCGSCAAGPRRGPGRRWSWWAGRTATRRASTGTTAAATRRGRLGGRLEASSQWLDLLPVVLDELLEPKGYEPSEIRRQWLEADYLKRDHHHTTLQSPPAASHAGAWWPSPATRDDRWRATPDSSQYGDRRWGTR